MSATVEALMRVFAGGDSAAMLRTVPLRCIPAGLDGELLCQGSSEVNGEMELAVISLRFGIAFGSVPAGGGAERSVPQTKLPQGSNRTSSGAGKVDFQPNW